MSKPIGASVYEPGLRNLKDKSRLTVIHCSLPEQYTCPLLTRGCCIEAQKFLTRGCIYGKTTVSDGYTRRAQRFRQRVRELEGKASNIGPMPASAPRRLVEVGEYIYLPYNHMDMCEAAPFKAHGGAFRTGSPFIQAQEFSARVIVTLATFRPYALLGGEIKDYQSKEVPRFLLHLSQDMKGLYVEAMSLMPELREKVLRPEIIKEAIAFIHDVTPYAEIKCIKGNDAKYGYWEWDGKLLTVRCDGARGLIFFLDSEVDGQTSVTFRPTKKFKVRVVGKQEIERLFFAGKLVI